MITFGNPLENSVKLAVSLLFMVDCQMLVFILFGPQGDAFQRWTEVLHCIAFCFYRQVEVQADLYHKAPLCIVLEQVGLSESEAPHKA